MKYMTLCSLALLAAFTVSCSDHSKTQAVRKSAFSGNSVILAERFSLEKTDSCTILTIIDPWQGAAGVKHAYFLVDRARKTEIKVDSSYIIPVPVRKIICMSSTHLAMISALNVQETVSGISGTGYIYDQRLRSRADSGLIGEIGYDAGINNELILSLNPDLIMMYGIGSESAGYVNRITELGTKVIYNADYLETDPLAKAEWIKVFGALYCKEKKADSIFTSIRASYNEIKSFVSSKTDVRPKILLGLPYKDTWFVSPGNSYISTLISDAGGEYLWKETRSTFSMPYSFESVYLESLKADFWLNPGSANSRSEIAAFDSKLSNIPSFSMDHIYNNTQRISPGGGNDYWESGTLNPHIILKDIASILHPGIFGNYSLYYYKKVE